MHKAKLVVGIHGSALTNVLWMQEGATLIEIFPDRYADPLYRSMAALLGTRWVRVVHCGCLM